MRAVEIMELLRSEWGRLADALGWKMYLDKMAGDCEWIDDYRYELFCTISSCIFTCKCIGNCVHKMAGDCEWIDDYRYELSCTV